jgi:rhamnosyltransferase
MRFAAGITLYNYTNDQVLRIKEYSKAFDKVFLFDNSEVDYPKPKLELDDRFIVISGEGNRGLPYAFNSIIDRCGEYDFLCTLDQDSVFLTDDINKIKLYLESYKGKEYLGIIAPYVDYGYAKHRLSESVEKKRWVITSGSFVNLNALRKEKVYYDNAYFIDKFEIDLCEHLLTKGYDVLMYHGSELHQSLGEDSGHNHPNHSALRHYYLFRNRLYFNNKWHSIVIRYFLNIAQTLRHELLILLYEENKWAKMLKLVPAIVDYYKGNMGKWKRVQ